MHTLNAFNGFFVRELHKQKKKRVCSMFTHNDALAAILCGGARCSHNNFIVPGCSFLESGKIQVRKVNALAAGVSRFCFAAAAAPLSISIITICAGTPGIGARRDLSVAISRARRSPTAPARRWRPWCMRAEVTSRSSKNPFVQFADAVSRH